MACKRSHIRHNNIVAYDAVMCYMGVGHHENIIADAGFIALAACTVNSAAFAEGAAVANNCIGFFTYKFQILRFCTNRAAREKLAILADFSVWMDSHMCANYAAVTNLRFLVNNSKGTNAYVLAKLRRRMNDGSFMDTISWHNNRTHYFHSPNKMLIKHLNTNIIL